MKKWLKWTLGILLLLIITVFILFIIRKKQISEFKASYIPAQHETQQSILDFAQQHNIAGEILIARDTNAFEKVNHLFAPGNIFVLDSEMKIVDINYGNYQGSCYFDIADHICDNFNFSGSKYNHEITDTVFVHDLISSTTFLTNYSWDKVKGYDYIVCYCWAKWMKTSYTNEGAVQKIIRCIKENSKHKILLVSINSDCVAPWYPITTELPTTTK